MLNKYTCGYVVAVGYVFYMWITNCENAFRLFWNIISVSCGYQAILHKWYVMDSTIWSLSVYIHTHTHTHNMSVTHMPHMCDWQRIHGGLNWLLMPLYRTRYWHQLSICSNQCLRWALCVIRSKIMLTSSNCVIREEIKRKFISMSF